MGILLDVSVTGGVVGDDVAPDVLEEAEAEAEGVLVELTAPVELGPRLIVVSGTPRSNVVTVGSG